MNMLLAAYLTGIVCGGAIMYVLHPHVEKAVKAARSKDD